MKHKLVKFAVLTGLVVAAASAGAAAPAPTLKFTRTPSPMAAGEDHHFQWSTTNATSLYIHCTTKGTGFVTSGYMALSGAHYSATNPAWVGNPSQCVYIVTGPGGKRTYYEKLETVNLPTLKFTRTPSPMVAGEDHHFQWSTTNATSLYIDCTTQGTGFVTSGYMALSGAHYSATNPAWVGNPSQCAYTVTGPSGKRTYYEKLETVNPPTLTFVRTPSPMVAGENHRFQWSTTDATSLYIDCTTQGTGFVTSGYMALFGDHYSATDAAWVGNPSQCTYTVTGPGGSRTYHETLETKSPSGSGTVVVDMGPPDIYLYWREPISMWYPTAYKVRSERAVRVNVTKKDGALVSIGLTEVLSNKPAGFPFCIQAYASGAWTEKQCLIPYLGRSITVGSPLAEPIYGLRVSAPSPNLANFGAVIAASATDTKGNSSAEQWSMPGGAVEVYPGKGNPLRSFSITMYNPDNCFDGKAKVPTPSGLLCY